MNNFRVEFNSRMSQDTSAVELLRLSRPEGGNRKGLSVYSRITDEGTMTSFDKKTEVSSAL